MPLINVYTNKCYGGITASFAGPSIADITLAEPSLVGFGICNSKKSKLDKIYLRDFNQVAHF